MRRCGHWCLVRGGSLQPCAQVAQLVSASSRVMHTASSDRAMRRHRQCLRELSPHGCACSGASSAATGGPVLLANVRTGRDLATCLKREARQRELHEEAERPLPSDNADIVARGWARLIRKESIQML